MFEVEYLVFTLHCFADNKLLYLDPHLCRDAVDTTASDFKTEVRETLHCCNLNHEIHVIRGIYNYNITF